MSIFEISIFPTATLHTDFISIVDWLKIEQSPIQCFWKSYLCNEPLLLCWRSSLNSKGHNQMQLYVSEALHQSETRSSVLQCCVSYYLPTVSYVHIIYKMKQLICSSGKLGREMLPRTVALKLGCTRQSTVMQKENVFHTINKKTKRASDYFYPIFQIFCFCVCFKMYTIRVVQACNLCINIYLLGCMPRMWSKCLKATDCDHNNY